MESKSSSERKQWFLRKTKIRIIRKEIKATKIPVLGAVHSFIKDSVKRFTIFSNTSQKRFDSSAKLIKPASAKPLEGITWPVTKCTHINHGAKNKEAMHPTSKLHQAGIL